MSKKLAAKASLIQAPPVATAAPEPAAAADVTSTHVEPSWLNDTTVAGALMRPSNSSPSGARTCAAPRR